jgi:hypothetical protein
VDPALFVSDLQDAKNIFMLISFSKFFCLLMEGTVVDPGSVQINYGFGFRSRRLKNKPDPTDADAGPDTS